MNCTLLSHAKNTGRTRPPRHSSKGVALIAALLGLSIITLIGLTMTFVSTTETLIIRNNRAQVQNAYAAESACEEARERLTVLLNDPSLPLSGPNQVVYIVADPSINPGTGNIQTNPYYDADFNAGYTVSLLNSNLSRPGYSWARLVAKTERWAHYNLDGAASYLNSSNVNVDGPVFYGFNRLQSNSQPTQYVNTGTYPASYTGTPVYLIAALARDQAGFKQVSRASVARLPVPPLRAVVYSRDALSVVDGTVIVQGEDEGGSGTKLNGLESQNNIGGDISGVAEAPASTLPFSSYSYDMDSLIKMLKPPASKEIEKVAPTVSRLGDGSYVGDGISLGQIPLEGNLSQAAFADGPLALSNSRGQGILVVNGDLSVSGSFIYYGLIIVKGKVLLNGASGAGIEIHGALLSSSSSGDQTTILQGNVRLVNNIGFIQKQFDALGFVQLSYQAGS
jgi:hypothetical protein